MERDQTIILVNFKTYERGTGDQAVETARVCAKHGAWVAVQATDIRSCVEQAGAIVFSQHVDPISHGKNTGHILPEAVAAAGARGTLLNHSEHRLDKQVIQATIQRCKQVGLQVVLCAESVEEGVEFSAYGADYIAVEIPELIGGDVSIMSSEPGIVQRAVDRIGPNVILGAGVGTGEDVRVAAQEGAAGVLPSSAVMKKAESAEAAVKELYSAIT